MSNRTRLALLAVPAVLALWLGWFFYSPTVLVWDAPFYAVAVMAGASWLLWFVVLLPVWFPALIPNSMPRLLRAMHLFCGVLLLLPLLPLAVFVLFGSTTKSITVGAFMAAVFGVWHLTLRSSRPRSASTELQR
jgi:hypothetical protein